MAPSLALRQRGTGMEMTVFWRTKLWRARKGVVMLGAAPRSGDQGEAGSKGAPVSGSLHAGRGLEPL